ncbi:phycobiliprotein lyase [Vasconcelosia minhoensis]|nr:phycobiliprotein lyase [Romeria gracilis]
MGSISMAFPRSTAPHPSTDEAIALQFFRQSAGEWESQRRYYTLKSGETQEVVSQITVEFLEPGHVHLLALAEKHNLEPEQPLLGGAKVVWESSYIATQRKPSKGSTVFGVRGSILYRDRGFATAKPVTADYQFRDAQTMVLKTAYGDSSFEEELKLIGNRYRTRQTIISRAGEEVMIGQYLEKRLA